MHNLVQYIFYSLHAVGMIGMHIYHYLLHLQHLQTHVPRLDPIISIMDEPMDPAMLLFGETPAAWMQIDLPLLTIPSYSLKLERQ
jgi:hypothetical protein